ncbi:hypothetical protein JTE90_007254 [Oedothorax gibbosus]|uniref:F-box domain-containing protein n=1 Tax=Oedothorax gibbosus TaxID=931172 RepID=A0AAV6VPS2_9ARAC|nr:hypothetical protein JTE90_007254 [Oedothorax gibbosus]
MEPSKTIQDLPDPIIEYILSYLSPYRDFKQCMLVNKSWYRYVYDVIRKTQRDFFHAVCHMSVQWSHLEASPGPTITKRYSHSACCNGNSMYIFGGCTTSNTTFNDLWRLDLGTRCWIRPLATGTYPPPKACATLVGHSDNLILFGGWTHTAPYPLHQIWRIFNQIHVYNTSTNRWTQITSPTQCPPMAGHSASVHGDYMVVYGGIQRQLCDGPFQSSSDIWTLDLNLYKWQKQTTTSETPPPRYGHSQIPIDKNHLLIMGGCGGANMLYNDVWLLKMVDGPGGLWEWQKMEVHEKESAAPHLAFHPACKVGNHVVVMNKGPMSNSSPATLPKIIHNPTRSTMWIPPVAQDNGQSSARHAKRPAPEVEQCINGKRGVLRRPAPYRQNGGPRLSYSSDEDETLETNKKASISHDPLSRHLEELNNMPSTSGYNSNGVGKPGNSYQPPSPFAEPPNDCANQDEPVRGGLRPINPECSVPEDGSKNIRRTKKRNEVLDRMSLRLQAMNAGNQPDRCHPLPHTQPFRTTRKRPMSMYVLDISTALDGYVTWKTLKNQSPTAPEEIILYSLVLGKGELIMFGGIQKDLNSQLQDDETSVPEIVSNCLHFMTAERFVI